MNTYKILTYDGYNCNTYYISGEDLLSALQSSYNLFSQSYVIKAELVDNQNPNVYINGN